MDDKVSDPKAGEKRPVVPYLGAVKIAAVIMGIMIVVGLAVIAVTIVKRVADKVGDDATIEAQIAPSPAYSPSTPTIAIGEVTAKLPKGAEIEALSVSGNTLLLSIKEAGERQVLIVDLVTGNRLGRVTFQPE